MTEKKKIIDTDKRKQLLEMLNQWKIALDEKERGLRKSIESINGKKNE